LFLLLKIHKDNNKLEETSKEAKRRHSTEQKLIKKKKYKFYGLKYITKRLGKETDEIYDYVAHFNERKFE
jgi:hypothetical protein